MVVNKIQQYIGSDLSLQCQVLVNAAVNNFVMIKYLWSVNGMTQSQLNQNSITYHPLRMSNNGEYSCKVTLSPVGSLQNHYITDGEQMAEIILSTKGNICST